METNNKSKKISELQTLHTLSSISRNKLYTWFPAAKYDTTTNSYSNVAVNLEAITNYCNSYTSYNIENIDNRLSLQEDAINKILNSYMSYITYGNTIPPSYIMAYCSTYTSYLIHDATKKISDNMVNLISKIKNPTSNYSYFRNNSKKISELTPRDTITYHKDHSWFAIAQYDSRVNAYVNLAMNLDTITGYCNSYSSYITTYNAYVLDQKINNLQNHVEVEVAYNVVSYAFSYSKDYFEWQFL